jgi:hypothetical protein
MKTLIVSKTALTVATVAFGAALSLPAAVIDFSTEPNLTPLTGDWTEHNYYAPGNQDNVVASWNATDQDLDLVGTAGASAANSIIGLYSNSDHTRSATESVTMTVKALAKTTTIGWGFLGLMIAADPLVHNYTAGTTDSYTLRMNALIDNKFQFMVGRTVADGGTWALHTSASQTFSGSYVLDIVRKDTGEYEFLANNVSLYTTTAATTGDDFYDATAKDSLLNYQMIMGGDGAMTATVDDFGIIPEPGTYALLGGLFALSFVMVRRR